MASRSALVAWEVKRQNNTGSYGSMTLEEMTAFAAENNLDLIVGQPYNLLVDLDEGRQLNDAVVQLLQRYYAVDIEEWPSRSGKGKHVLLSLSHFTELDGPPKDLVDLSYETRIALQTALGSDPIREAVALFDEGETRFTCLLRPKGVVK